MAKRTRRGELGERLCATPDCPNEPSAGKVYAGLCKTCHERASRPLCSEPGCCNEACDPVDDKRCASHHPLRQQTSPIVAQVVHTMQEQRIDPVSAMAQVAGLSQPAAARALERVTRNDPAGAHQIREVMASRGITDDLLFDTLRSNLTAEQPCIGPDGEVVRDADGTVVTKRDMRASNTALDMAFKLRGDYAPKVTEKTVRRFNVSVTRVEVPPMREPPPEALIRAEPKKP